MNLPKGVKDTNEDLTWGFNIPSLYPKCFSKFWHTLSQLISRRCDPLIEIIIILIGSIFTFMASLIMYYYSIDLTQEYPQLCFLICSAPTEGNRIHKPPYILCCVSVFAAGRLTFDDNYYQYYVHRRAHVV